MLVITLMSTLLLLLVVGLIGFGVVGIWQFVDAFLIPGIVRRYNNELVGRLTQNGALAVIDA